MAMRSALAVFPRGFWNRQRQAAPGVLPLAISVTQKWISSFSQTYKVIYSEHGDPEKVLHDQTEMINRPPLDKTVLVKMMMAPINTSDLDIISGSYFIQPPVPAVGGNEGVGRVLEVGNGVETLLPGDWVIPARSGWGTWRTLVVSDERDFTKVPNDMPILGAATLAVNPCTAYRMLKGFIKLNPGDTVIQNGGNTSVGHAVIQLCKAWGLTTINVIRSTDDVETITRQLTELGANHIITDEFFRSDEMAYFLKATSLPRLALDCDASELADLMKETLGENAVMVTYGGMPAEDEPEEPEEASESQKCFKDETANCPRGKECASLSGEQVLSGLKNPLWRLLGSRSQSRGMSSKSDAPPPPPPPELPEVLLKPPEGKVVFKEILGYWRSMWEEQDEEDPNMEEMVAELCEMMKNGQLLPPVCDLYTLDMYQLAIKKAKETEEPRRVMFKIDDELIV